MQNRALITLCFALTAFMTTPCAHAQMGPMVGGLPMVSQASYMVPSDPSMSPTSGSMYAQAMYQPGGAMAPGMIPPGAIAPVGYFSPSACDSGYCGPGGCCAAGGCDGMGCCQSGPGGLVGELCNGGRLNGLQNLCMFCRGSGCSVCQAPSNAGHLLGLLGVLAPYTDAGLCAQRSFDFRAEYMMLSLNSNVDNRAITSSGVGSVDPVTGVLNADRVLGTGDVSSSGLAPGFRLTGSLMFGAGGNLEATYFGTNHYSEYASVGSMSGPADLYSAFSNFGTSPAGGFDDTDRSLVQSLRATSEIHSGEANYRRRWVGPYCRFQGSWLIGFRYFDYDGKLAYNTIGELNDTSATPGDRRYFQSHTQTRNSLTGAQLGGDLWWNIYPGVNLGLGWKGAVFGNTAQTDTAIRSNSIDLAGLTELKEFSQGSKTAAMSELQARLAYRLTYSWTFTAAYWFVAVDGLALPEANLNTRNASQLFSTATPRTYDISIEDSITMHGFTLGLEYLW